MYSGIGRCVAFDVVVFVPLRLWVESMALQLEENGMHLSVMACHSSPSALGVAHTTAVFDPSLAEVAESEATLLSANALATILYRFDS